MTLSIFYLATFLSVIVILVCVHLNQNCSHTRLIKEYRQKQYERNQIVNAQFNVDDLIRLIGPDRLRLCYGIKIHEVDVGDPILYTTCDWDIAENIKARYTQIQGPASQKFIK